MQSGTWSGRNGLPPIVPRRELKEALLDLLGDGKEHHDDEIVPTLAERFAVSQHDRARRLASGRSVLGNEIDWAKKELNEENRIERLGPKRYRLADRAPSSSDTSVRITIVARTGVDVEINRI